MDKYDAAVNAEMLALFSDEMLRKLKYTLSLQIDGLLLKSMASKAIAENKSIEEVVSDCIEKGLEDE